MSENRAELLRLLNVNRLHVEYWEGRWHWPSNAEPKAIVTFAAEARGQTASQFVHAAVVAALDAEAKRRGVA